MLRILRTGRESIRGRREQAKQFAEQGAAGTC